MSRGNCSSSKRRNSRRCGIRCELNADFLCLPLYIVECSWVSDRLYVPDFVMIQTTRSRHMYVPVTVVFVVVVAAAAVVVG